MLTIRPRRPDDLPVIVGWVPDAAALYLFTGPRLTWPLTVDQLLASDLEDGRMPWVATDDADPRALVGHFDLRLSDGVARLGRVIVDPARRGHGLGIEMMRLALHRARTDGATSMDLIVVDGNTAALHTYQRLGFEPLPTRERADATLMKRAL